MNDLDVRVGSEFTFTPGEVGRIKRLAERIHNSAASEHMGWRLMLAMDVKELMGVVSHAVVRSRANEELPRG